MPPLRISVDSDRDQVKSVAGKASDNLPRVVRQPGYQEPGYHVGIWSDQGKGNEKGAANGTGIANNPFESSLIRIGRRHVEGVNHDC